MIIKVVVLSVLYITIVRGDERNASAKIGGKYETKYDNIDLDELLENNRLRKNYIKCLLGEGPCTPDAQELKSKENISLV